MPALRRFAGGSIFGGSNSSGVVQGNTQCRCCGLVRNACEPRLNLPMSACPGTRVIKRGFLHVRMWAVCLASFFFLQCLSAQGQAPRSPAWERLSNARGKEVQVRLSGGKSRQGRLSDVTDEGIHLRSGSDEFSLARNEVIQVYELRKKARKRSALIGTAVGGGAGAIIGA